MKKKLFALCAFAFIFSFGCAEKKETPEPKAAEPAQTQPRVSGAAQPSETSVSGLRQAHDGETHVSGN